MNESVKLESVPAKALLLGRGELSWPKNERVSDRYGAVQLLDKDENSLDLSWPPKNKRKGKLLVEVVEARKSEHIGDLFRGIFPRHPATGEVYFLGEGTASHGEFSSILVEPKEERSNDWLNPRALYDVHGSIVNLWWEPIT